MTLSPGTIGAQFFLGRALLSQGDSQAALEAIQQESLEPHRLLGEVMAYHALGQKAASDSVLAELIEKDEQEWAGGLSEYFYTNLVGTLSGRARSSCRFT